MEHGLAEMTQIKQQEISEEQKIDILKKSLFALVGKINSNVSISQEQINSYVENKKTELAEFFYPISENFRDCEFYRKFWEF